MCSTPRRSASIKHVHHLSSSSSHIKSDIQMMRKASDLYDRRQQEREKRRAKHKLEKQLLSSDISENDQACMTEKNVKSDLCNSGNNFVKSNHLMFDIFKRISCILQLIRDKISPIIT